MPPQKPTILLISGGWHLPATYTKFTRALEAAGFPVHIPRLLSVTNAAPTHSLDDDTAMIRREVEALVQAGQTVIAVMHSYGGAVGTSALHGLGVESRARENKGPGGVAHLIYMCASVFVSGAKMSDMIEYFGDMDRMGEFDFTANGAVVCRDAKQKLVTEQGSASSDEIDAYLASMQLWNPACMQAPIATKRAPAWEEIPTSYAFTTKDDCVPYKYQVEMVRRLKEAGKELDEVVEMSAGHSPNLTHCPVMVGFVEQIAGKVMMQQEEKVKG